MIKLFRGMTPCRLLNSCRCFGRVCCFHHQCPSTAHCKYCDTVSEVLIAVLIKNQDKTV